MAGEVRAAESTGILQKYGAGDENRIAFQISKHRKKVLPAALRANCCQTLPSRMRAGHLHWSGDARDNQAFAVAELTEKDLTATASSSIISKTVSNFVNRSTSRTVFAGLRSFSSP